MNEADLRRLMQPLVNHIAALERRLVAVERAAPHLKAVSDYHQQLASWDNDAAAKAAEREQRRAQWRRNIVIDPASFETWTPQSTYDETGYVVRHLPNDDGVVRAVAVLITSDNRDELAEAQGEWEQRHPDLAEKYRRGPRARVVD